MPTKKSSTKSSTKKGGVGAIGTVIALLIVVVLGGYYFTSGSDPFGLFGGTKPTETAAPTLSADTNVDTPEPDLEPTSTPVEDMSFSPTSSWWDAYFVSPLRLNESEELAFRTKIPAKNYTGSIAEKLIQHIDEATKTIHIASFEFDLTDIANALIRAQKRGVDVRWVTDDEHGLEADGETGHGQFKAIKAAGVKVKDDARGALMHNKFWLFDGQIVWTGSTNVTVSGMFEQDNNVIVIYSPDLAAIYERQFEEMWAGQFNAKSPSAVRQQALTIDGTAIQVLFSPEDNAISQIVPYIQKAKSSIRFMAFVFTHDDLGGAMIERKKAGVDVQGVFEATGSDTEYSEMIPLYCAKAPVRKDGNPAFLHHKVIIVDERIVITGSLNFTENADESNNENVIIIDNAEIAALYLRDYQRIWAAGKEADPAKMKCK